MISLDFELMWGIHPDLDVDKYIINLKNTPLEVEKTQNVFQWKFHITNREFLNPRIGKGRNEAFDYFPQIKPSYKT